MESREELIERAERGRRVAEFMADPHIAGIYQDTMKRIRESINMLRPEQQMEFTIGQASAQAIDGLWIGLQGFVEIGAEAEAELLEDPAVESESEHRGIL